MIEPIRIGSVANRASETATGLADTIIAASRVGGTGVVNTTELAAKVAAVGAGNPQQAATLAREVNGQLPPGDRLPFQTSLKGELAARNLPPSPEGGAAAAKARSDLALDVTQMALDIAGLFDPTPVSDGSNAVISLFRGDFLGAGLSAVSIIPYIGDAAKLGKLGKWAQTIERAVDLAKTDSAFARMAGPALDKLKDAIGGVPKSVLDALPKSARDTLLKIKDKLDDLGGAGARPAEAAAPAAVRATERNATVGANEVTWKLDSAGRPTHAEATLVEVQPAGTTRSSAETSAQDQVRGRGIADDDAGHIIGHRFMPDQGTVNMFPQNLNFNRGAYKTMENEWAGWIDAGGTVKVKVELSGGTSARPDTVSVSYEVRNAAGQRVFKNDEQFSNIAGQTFDRVPTADINTLMGK